jgi:hypothetical protein
VVGNANFLSVNADWEESFWDIHGGFHSHGATPIAGWVYKEKTENNMDDDWGYPHLWKPHITISEYRRHMGHYSGTNPMK